jgi:tRNA (cmo5U34)-methyltransferase
MLGELAMGAWVSRSKASTYIMTLSVDEWSNPERVTEYLLREIPYRDVAEGILLDALPDRVERILDLGTGDGRMLALVRKLHPEAYGVGVDSSAPMLRLAAKRFVDQTLVEVIEHDLKHPLGGLGHFDAVVSALAIHHLEDERKRALFGEIHALLVPGGVFVNLDLVTSATVEQHELFRRAIGRPQDDPTDRLADLCEQQSWLRDAGFTAVDCHFKWLELALVVGRRGQ